MKTRYEYRKGGLFAVLGYALIIAGCGSSNNNNSSAVPVVAPAPVLTTCVGGTACATPTGAVPILMAAGGSGARTISLGLAFYGQGAVAGANGFATTNYSGPFVAQGEFDVASGANQICISASGASQAIPPGTYSVQVTSPAQMAYGGYLSNFQMVATGPVQVTFDLSSATISPAQGTFTSPFSGASYSYYLNGNLNIDALNGVPCAPIPLVIGP